MTVRSEYQSIAPSRCVVPKAQAVSLFEGVYKNFIDCFVVQKQAPERSQNDTAKCAMWSGSKWCVARLVRDGDGVIMIVEVR
jgi:hypothetical protein